MQFKIYEEDQREYFFNVTSDFTGKAAPWKINGATLYSGNILSITCVIKKEEEETTVSSKMFFPFYGSYIEPRLQEDQFIFAVYCLFEEALSALQFPTVEEFASEFGYDLEVLNGAEAKKTLQKCKQIGHKLGVLCENNTDEEFFYNVCNYIEDNYPDSI